VRRDMRSLDACVGCVSRSAATRLLLEGVAGLWRGLRAGLSEALLKARLAFISRALVLCSSNAATPTASPAASTRTSTGKRPSLDPRRSVGSSEREEGKAEESRGLAEAGEREGEQASGLDSRVSLLAARAAVGVVAMYPALPASIAKSCLALALQAAGPSAPALACVLLRASLSPAARKPDPDADVSDLDVDRARPRPGRGSKPRQTRKGPSRAAALAFSSLPPAPLDSSSAGSSELSLSPSSSDASDADPSYETRSGSEPRPAAPSSLSSLCALPAADEGPEDEEGESERAAAREADSASADSAQEDGRAPGAAYAAFPRSRACGWVCACAYMACG
jgi:hypothetical protein